MFIFFDFRYPSADLERSINQGLLVKQTKSIEKTDSQIRKNHSEFLRNGLVGLVFKENYFLTAPKLTLNTAPVTPGFCPVPEIS